MRILLVITSVPFAKDYSTITNLLKNFSARNHRVSLFLTGNGVYYLVRPDADILKEHTEKVYYCSHAAHQRGVDKQPPWAESSSTYNLSKMVEEFDKVIVFN